MTTKKEYTNEAKRKIKAGLSIGGRPQKKIDYKTLDSLCQIQCTGEECASILGMDYDTLNNRLKEDGNGCFSDYYNEKAPGGRASLRRRQYKAAMEGNATMLVWLGKNWLGQTDKHESTVEVEHKGGVMRVPEVKDVTAWEEGAEQSQAELKESLNNDE